MRRDRYASRSAYFARDGSEHQDVSEYLVAEVCHGYSQDEVPHDELEARIEAALCGDWRGAGYQFGPPLMSEVIWR